MAIPASELCNEEYALVPPDGGWGWVIVAAAFYCHLVIDGVQLSFGMIIMEMADYYEVYEYSIALIGSLMYGTHFLAGPLCAALSRRLGERTVCILGAVLTSFGLSTAYFRPPYYVLYLTIGLIGGSGLCFLSMNSIVITSLYFSRKRIIALGIVVCGTGVGTMLFVVMSTYTLKILTWEYFVLIEALFALSTILAAATFRPLDPIEIRTSIHTQRATFEEVTVDDDDEPVNPRFYFVRNEDSSHPSTRASSVHSLFDKTDRILDEYVLTVTNPETECRTSRLHRFFNRLCHRVRRRTRRILFMSPETKASLLVPCHLPEEDPSQRRRTFSQLWDSMGCGLLTSPSFVLFCVSGALSAAAMLNIFFYEKVRLSSHGASAEELMGNMVSLGFSNVVWRLLLSVLPNLPKMNYRTLNIIGLAVGGVATLASGLSAEPTYTHTFGFLMSLAVGCFAVYYPVILLDYVELCKISTATGMTMMFMGVVSIIVPPMSGLAMLETDDLNIPFYIAGALFVSSSLIFLLIQCGRGFGHH